MSDLISRQAAIDAILHITNCKSVRELFEYNQEHHLTEMWSGGVNDAIDAVIGVESATDTNVATKVGTNLAEVGTDLISRAEAIEAVQNRHMMLSKEKVLLINDIKKLPSAQPYTIHSDGRLWITVDDIDKVTAVVVDEHKSKFCKQFYEDYEDAQPEIIYCKDCKHFIRDDREEHTPYGFYNTYFSAFCDKHWDKEQGEYIDAKLDDYCSFAERRTGWMI